MESSAIQAQVERVIASRVLRSSPNLVRLLRFLTDETLAGRADRLKEYTLGTEVFDRGEGFDPRVDTIVRVQARRLRGKLCEYYEAEGAADPVTISLAPGSYVPHFAPREGRTPATASSSRRPLARRVATAGAFIAIAGLLWVWPLSGLVSRSRVPSTTAGGTYTANPEAHAFYLQAKAAYSRGTRTSIGDSIRLFEKSTRADPRYAAAFAGLAYAYLFESSNFEPPSRVMPRARAAALAARALDGTNIEAHTALGQVALFYDWDFDAAQASADRALSLNAYSAPAHDLRAQILTARGDFNGAAVEIQRAQDADPLSPAYAYDAAWNLIYARRYSEAAEASRRALERDPNFQLARGVLGLSLVLDGRVSDGIPELERAAADGESSVLDLLLVHGYAFAGRDQDAAALLERVTASAGRRYVCAYEVGSAHAALGNVPQSLAWLSRAIDERSDCMVWLRAESWLAQVRADPGFGRLVARLATPAPPLTAGTIVTEAEQH